MDWLLSVNNELSNWLWGYRNVLITSWVAVVLVLFGSSINKLVKRVMQPYHYIFRMLAFVLLCAVGYGLMSNYGEIGVYWLVTMPGRHWFALIVVATYLSLGMLAERMHHA